MLQWFISRDDERASPRDARGPASEPAAARPDLADLHESECEAHCLYPPPGVA